MSRARSQRGPRDQRNGQRAFAADAPERLRERPVADVFRREREIAVRRLIANGHRLHMAFRLDDRLQQRALQRQHLDIRIVTGAQQFGKLVEQQRDPLAAEAALVGQVAAQAWV